jgi:DNA-binding NarL/FixJ family response regulator
MLDVWIMASLPPRRDWLSKCINAQPEMRVAGTASTFAFLRSLMLDSSADVSLIEVGSEAQSTTRDWLFELLELTPVVLLSREPEPIWFNRLRRSGEGGLLHANASSEQIIQAIKSVAAGLTIFDGSLAPSSSDDESAVEALTPREAEVLRLLAVGLGNKEIALRLSVSEHTIKFHIHSILGKLGAASRTEAVTRGLRSGLIEL